MSFQVIYRKWEHPTKRNKARQSGQDWRFQFLALICARNFLLLLVTRHILSNKKPGYPMALTTWKKWYKLRTKAVSGRLLNRRLEHQKEKSILNQVSQRSHRTYNSNASKGDESNAKRSIKFKLAPIDSKHHVFEAYNKAFQKKEPILKNVSEICLQTVHTRTSRGDKSPTHMPNPRRRNQSFPRLLKEVVRRTTRTTRSKHPSILTPEGRNQFWIKLVLANQRVKGED